VNNAGTVIPGYTDYLTDADFRNVMEVNFFGAVNVTRLCLLRLKESRGRICCQSAKVGHFETEHMGMVMRDVSAP
jgi:NAD(P)-dependent dehydrogenase (short-subunit alcohol dehydrogenase family)